MVQLEHIDAKEFIPNYDFREFNRLGIFLRDNYQTIGGRNNDVVNPDIVHQVSIRSYQSIKDGLLIIRLTEGSYPLSDYNKMLIKYDKLILHSPDQESIDRFVDELKKEFL